uniref:Uncharacterized protein n=1 Tax=Aegilops tauschii subsp. strangulata TaxID=200361 RepID=A0A453QCK7_AEGTS
RRNSSLGPADTPPRASGGAASRHAHAAAVDVLRREGAARPVRPAVRRGPRARRRRDAASGFAASFDEKMTSACASLA